MPSLPGGKRWHDDTVLKESYLLYTKYEAYISDASDHYKKFGEILDPKTYFPLTPYV